MLLSILSSALYLQSSSSAGLSGWPVALPGPLPICDRRASRRPCCPLDRRLRPSLSDVAVRSVKLPSGDRVRRRTVHVLQDLLGRGMPAFANDPVALFRIAVWSVLRAASPNRTFR